MAGTDFFVKWELWMQMTFVLGLAILIVMIAGLVKLAFIRRRVRKHAALDLEKKSRVAEMRSSGLSERGNDIPFGVRAIQNGVEVDGIWISRPTTPNVETPLVHTPVNFGSIAPPKVHTPTEGGRVPIHGAVEVRSLTSKNGLRGPGPMRTSIYRPKHAPHKLSPRANESYNADALSLLEGSSGRGAPQTYMPSRQETTAKGAYQATATSDYPDYFAQQRDPKDPFATPDASEQGSPEDQESPIGEIYAGEVQSSHATQRNNAGFEPKYSTAEASQIDLESGGYPRPGKKF